MEHLVILRAWDLFILCFSDDFYLGFVWNPNSCAISLVTASPRWWYHTLVSYQIHVQEMKRFNVNWRRTVLSFVIQACELFAKYISIVEAMDDQCLAIAQKKIGYPEPTRAVDSESTKSFDEICQDPYL